MCLGTVDRPRFGWLVSAVTDTVPSDGAGHEPALDDVARDYPRWHCWEGISGLFYASLRRSSPPVTVRGKDPADLRDSIREWIKDH
jgi:hypothetical protein